MLKASTLPFKAEKVALRLLLSKHDLLYQDEPEVTPVVSLGLGIRSSQLL